MAAVTLDRTLPSAPGSGVGKIFIDPTAAVFGFLDSAGRYNCARSLNAAIAAQAGGFAADTYLTNSDLLIPSFGLQAKAVFYWTMSASKTNQGTATPIYIVRIGTGRTTSDSAILTLTGPAQTAVVDIGTLHVLVTVRSIGGSGVIQGSAWWDHTGTAANTTTQGTGFANNGTGHVEGTSGPFDNQLAQMAGKYVGLSVNGGSSAVWSPTQVIASADW